MITTGQARTLLDSHLGDSFRARHSVFVGALMKALAERLGTDAALWEITGLCHDLDFAVTAQDRSRHGLVTAEWLKGRLPDEALQAIRAHDHRTGVAAETMLADVLKLSDAIAIGEATAGRGPMVAALADPDPDPALRSALAERPYLPEMILRLSRKHALPTTLLADLVRTAPPQ